MTRTLNGLGNEAPGATVWLLPLTSVRDGAGVGEGGGVPPPPPPPAAGGELVRMVSRADRTGPTIATNQFSTPMLLPIVMVV